MEECKRVMIGQKNSIDPALSEFAAKFINQYRYLTEKDMKIGYDVTRQSMNYKPCTTFVLFPIFISLFFSYSSPIEQTKRRILHEVHVIDNFLICSWKAFHSPSTFNFQNVIHSSVRYYEHKYRKIRKSAKHSPYWRVNPWALYSILYTFLRKRFFICECVQPGVYLVGSSEPLSDLFIQTLHDAWWKLTGFASNVSHTKKSNMDKSNDLWAQSFLISEHTFAREHNWEKWEHQFKTLSSLFLDTCSLPLEVSKLILQYV